ncbi:hypothetical protein DER46DRAFT_501635 [Fusarium sp. MPI-SDFR-AT-0072]|nr:hypothetical protein DER46DRAFT_501635 [Fusarium sp. MPI-SDFR-AT-0072]
MDQTQAQVELYQVLNPSILDKVYEFWFRHLADDDHSVVPDKQEALVWFSQNDDYDKECISNFGPTLEALRSIQNLGMKDILNVTQPKSPSQWISLIILLDQVPRNCYRGERAGVAYHFFDPLVLEIALRAIAVGIPEQTEVRYRHSYRFWFYLPLEHSERMEILNMVVKEHDKMFGSSHELMEDSDNLQDAEALHCRQVLMKRREQFEVWEMTLRGIVKDHMNLIERFGRYPHRNGALGRESTEEEIQHLGRTLA